MSLENGSDDALTGTLDRLLDPVEELLTALAPHAAPAESARRERTRRGENVSATIAIPTSLARRGGQTFVRFSVLTVNPDGPGRVEVARRLNVTFPPGVAAGDNLRVSGEGNESPNGGPPGDLVLSVLLVRRGGLARVFPRRAR